MARARNIKPGFFTNDVLAEIHPLGRILFAGLWTIADREGRLEDRPKKIKAEVLPFDNCNVEKLLSEISQRGFITRYVVDGIGYIQITNWKKHQNPHIKEAESTIPAPEKHSASTVQAPDKEQPKPERAGLIPDSLNLIPDSPQQPASTTPTGVGPEPPKARANPSPAAVLSKALRVEGIESQPADPRLIAMAEQGITPETLQAAAAEAKRAKPGERIPVGYVVGIVERWAKEAAALSASGAAKPAARMNGRQAAISNYAAQAAAARGESNERAASSERDITGEAVRIA